MSKMASREQTDQLSTYECHFNWNLEEETIKNHSNIMNEINRHIKENPDMKIEALLFKGYLFVSNFNGVVFKKKEDALLCFSEVKQILSGSKVAECIQNGYLAVTWALEAFIDRGDKTKLEENILKLSTLYSSVANDDKFFASIQATKAFALLKVSVTRSDQIISNFRKAVRACPDNHEWLFSLGLILWRRAKISCQKTTYLYSEFNEAERIFKDVLKMDHENNHAMILLADIFKRKKKFGEAHQFLQRAVEINRNRMYIIGFSAKLYREMQMYTQERDVLNRAENLGDPSSFVLHQISQMYDHEGDATSSIHYLKKAIEVDNCNIGAIAGLGLALEKNGQIEEAYEHYDLMLRSFDQDNSRIIQITNSFALFLLRLGNVDEAVLQFEAALNQALEHFQIDENADPVSFHTVIKFPTYVLIKKLRDISSERMLSNPNDINLILHRAKLEIKLRCFEDATKYLNRAIMAPDLDVGIKFEVLCYLADIKIRIGDLSSANKIVYRMQQLGIDVKIVNTYKGKLAVEQGKLAYKSGNTTEGYAYLRESISLGSIEGARCLQYEMHAITTHDTDYFKLCAEIEVLSETNGGELKDDIQRCLDSDFDDATIGGLRKIQFAMEKHIFLKLPALEYAKNIIHKTRIILNRMMIAFRERNYPETNVPCTFLTVNNCMSQRDVQQSVKDKLEKQYQWRNFERDFDQLFHYIISIQPVSNPEVNNWMIALQKMDDEENQYGNLGDIMEIELYLEDKTTRQKITVKKEFKTVEIARTACDNIADILRMFNKY